MLVINESKLKLLKMKEKLLEVAIENRDEIINDYQKIASEIDHEIFEKLLENVENTNLYNHTMEEQLDILNNINREYKELFDLQSGFKNIYSTYSNKTFELSDLSIFNIDKLRDKINAIQGYLLNNEKIDNYKTMLDELNVDLANEEKKKIQIQRKFLDLEEKLKNNFINAEGRLYDSYGNLEYTSITDEYKKASFDIKDLLNNRNKLLDEIRNMNSIMDSSQEKLNDAKICYENVRNKENEDIHNSILKENTYYKYKLLLLNIADLIQEEFKDYKLLKRKRQEIEELNVERVNCLNILDIKLFIDPFSRIKIDEQINLIESLGDNEDRINSIRKQIVDLSKSLETCIHENDEYHIIIASDTNFIQEEQKNEEGLKNDATISIDKEKVIDVAPNQIIAVSNIPDTLVINRVNEKTKEVVKRVCEIFCHKEIVKDDIVSPELIIDDKKDEYIPNNEESLNLNKQEETEEAFPDIIKLDDDSSLIDNNLFTSEENNDIFEDTKESFVISNENNNKQSNDDLFITENSEDIFTEDKIPLNESSNETEKDNSNLFEEVENPFTSVPLFKTKYDKDSNISILPLSKNFFEPKYKNEESNTLEETIEKESKDEKTDSHNEFEDMSMPDIFWTVEDSQHKKTEDNPSFDEQIDALVNNAPKVLKKVA